MHDDLKRSAFRRGMAWVAAFVLASNIPVSVWIGINISWPGAVGFYIVAVILTFVLIFRPGHRVVRGSRPKEFVRAPDARLTNIAAGLASATGTTPARIGWVEHPAPNVACLPEKDGPVLIVSAGAMRHLSRDAVEALCAAQLAVAQDRQVAMLLRAWSSVALFRGYSILSLLLMFLVWIPGVLYIWGAWVGFFAVAWVLGGRIRWWAYVAADAVCIATTRHPEALASACEMLARYEGRAMPVKSWFSQMGTADGFFAAPVSAKWSGWTSGIDGTESESSSAMHNAIRLATRAEAIRKLSRGDADLDHWQEINRRLGAAGKKAALGETVVVGGIEIGKQGAVDQLDRNLDASNFTVDKIAPPPGSESWTYEQAVVNATRLRPPAGLVQALPTFDHACALAAVVRLAPEQDREYWQNQYDMAVDIARLGQGQRMDKVGPPTNMWTLIKDGRRIKARFKSEYGVNIY